jgi:hypothetical protein
VIATTTTASFDATAPSLSSLRGLDGVNLFLAGIQSGFGPFVAVVLAHQKWTLDGISGSVLGVLTALIVVVPLADSIWPKALLGRSLVSARRSAPPSRASSSGVLVARSDFSGIAGVALVTVLIVWLLMPETKAIIVEGAQVDGVR